MEFVRMSIHIEYAFIVTVALLVQYRSLIPYLTYEVYDDDGIVTVLFVLPAVVIRIRQDEGGDVRCKYSGIQHEQQYHPIPNRFEGWIV